MPERAEGWAWFAPAGETEGFPTRSSDRVGARAEDDESRELARVFARCFRGRNGARVLGHLRAVTVERRLGPEASEALLRHLEGQRHLVAYIESLVARGRS